MAVGNFVVIYYPGEEMETESKEDAEMGMEKETESERAHKRKKFEKYIYEHRPYLNPRFTDNGSDAGFSHEPNVYLPVYQPRIWNEFLPLYQYATPS